MCHSAQNHKHHARHQTKRLNPCWPNRHSPPPRHALANPRWDKKQRKTRIFDRNSPKHTPTTNPYDQNHNLWNTNYRHRTTDLSHQKTAKTIENITKKAFIIATAILMAIIIIVCNVPNIINLFPILNFFLKNIYKFFCFFVILARYTYY